jgi:hypothetical protein
MKFLEFYNYIKENNPPEDYELSLDEYLDYTFHEVQKTFDDFKDYLEHNKIDYDEVTLDEKYILIRKKKAHSGGYEYDIIDESLYSKDLRQWLWDLSDSSIYQMTNYDYEFWNNDFERCNLFHATKEENVESILKDGLLTKNESRGLTNRFVGSAIFTSTEMHEMSTYGDYIFEIDTDTMKKDGYMPRVTLEPEVEDHFARINLISKLGLRDFFFDFQPVDSGMEEDTRIVHGNIPAKYLTLLNK